MPNNSFRDGYVRLPKRGAPISVSNLSDRPSALLFVDIEARPQDALDTVRRLRELPTSTFFRTSDLLVRMPNGESDAQDDALTQQVLEYLRQLMPEIAPDLRHAAVIRARVGQPFHVEHDGEALLAEDELIRRARAAEVTALLTVNHAIWRPNGYHFKLPNGMHASSFVRVADAIATPQDAQSLAFWLLPDLARGRGLVLDNRSMTPLALAVQRAFDHAGVPHGPIAVLEHYPDSQVDVEAAVRLASDEGGGVLAIQSVSSRGDTRDRLIAALTRAAQPEYKLHVLLDRNLAIDQALPGGTTAETTTWLGFRLDGDILDAEQSCTLCLRSDSRRVVGIDPRFFDGMVIPDPSLRMPSPQRAALVAPFWEECDIAGAVGIERPAVPATQSRRARLDGQAPIMGVFVSVARLVASPQFRDRSEQHLRQLVSRRTTDRYEYEPPSEALKDIDLIVYADSEGELVGFDELLSALKDSLPGGDKIATCNVDVALDPARWPNSNRDALRASTHVLIFAVGAVTGYALQRLLVGCQEHLRAARAPSPVTGLVLHARPSTDMEWRTLCNSFNRRLYSLYYTPLPPASPLRSEATTLLSVRAELDDFEGPWRDRLLDFISRRSELANGYGPEVSADSAGEYEQLLWGAPDSDTERARVRQHSVFGHKIGQAALIAAVGTTVHCERMSIGAEEGPVWSLFDIPAILRSYYDALIVATMIRWFEPGEMWWGSPAEAEQAITALLERASIPDLAVLIPELLLAAGQAKIPQSGANLIEARAVQLVEQPPVGFGESELVAIGAGLITWQAEKGRRGVGNETGLSLPPWPLE